MVEECITELNITPELALALIQWDLPDDDRGFVRCILTRMQLFDDKTGRFHCILSLNSSIINATICYGNQGFNRENLELQLDHNGDLNRVRMIIEKCTDIRLNLDLIEMFARRGAQCMMDEKLTLVREE